ncbi:MAG: hypothetical protein JNK77_02195 [Saprospiraceae bacterium]|nr:hypothetical protein [Saprospiraceae bacterium]
MRTRPVFPSFYLICCSLLFSQMPGWGQTGYDIVERSMYLSDDIAMIHTSDSGVLIANHEFPLPLGITFSPDFRLSKIDAADTLSWRRYYKGAQGNIKGIIASDDTSHLILLNNYLVKVGKMGQTLWAKAMNYPGFYVDCRAIIPAGDTAYFLAGTLYPGFVNASSGFIAKIDTSGNLLWSKRWEAEFHYLEMATIALVEGNRFAFTGFTANPNSYDEDILVGLADSTGEVIWMKRVGSPTNERGQHLAFLPPDRIVITGAAQGLGVGGQDVFVLQTDILGKVGRLDTYGTPGIESIHKVLPTNNGQLLLTGLLQDRALLCSVDTSGYFRWAHLSDTTSSSGQALDWAYDSSLLVLKTFDAGNTTGRWNLSKIGAFGDYSCQGTSEVTLEQRSYYLPQRRLNARILPGHLLLTTVSIIDSIVAPGPPISYCIDSCEIVATFHSSTYTPCVGESVVFSNHSQIAQQYEWHINDVWVGATADLTYSFSAPGDYRVALVAINAFCSDTAVVWIRVPDLVQAKFSASRQLLVVQFHDLSGGHTSRLWQFGDGLTSTLDHPEHVYDAIGSYEVCLTVMNRCDTAQMCETIQVRDTRHAAFRTVFGPEDLDQQWADAVIPAKDGSFIVTGFENAISSNSNYLFLKIDSTGHTVWSRSLGWGEDEEAFCLTECYDLGYAMAGSSSSLGRRMLLVRISRQGDVYWERSFPVINPDDRPYGIITTRDTGIVVTGRSANGAYVLKVDDLGNKKWLHFYAGGKSGSEIIELPNGDFLVAGESIYIGDIYVLRIDSQGQVLWSKSYGGPGTEAARGMTMLADGTFLITGNTNSYGVGNQDCFLLRIDENGNVISSKTYGIANPKFNEFGVDVYQTPSGAVHLISAFGNLAPFSIKFDSTGQITGSKAYLGTNFSNSYNGGHITYDEGIILAGHVEIGQQSYASVIKTDSSGFLACSSSELAVIQNEAPFAVSSVFIDSILPVNLALSEPIGSNTILPPYQDVITCYSDNTCNGFGLQLTATPLSCGGGGNDGAVSASIVNGTPPFQFNWNTGDTTSVLTGLPLGQYVVMATDANGCFTSKSIPIIQDIVQAQVSVIPNACVGPPSGSIAVVVTSGQAPYAYQWSNGSTEDHLEGLEPGTYGLTISDALGCQRNFVATVPQAGLGLISSLLTYACNGQPTGSGMVEVYSGHPPYAYSWSNGDTTMLIENLLPGGYTVTVTDAFGCVKTDGVQIDNFVFETAVVTEDVSCSMGADGSATVVIVQGEGPIAEYTWSIGSSSSEIADLQAGVYQVTVFNSYTCVNVHSFVINAPPSLVLETSSTPDQSHTGAFDGTASVTAQGGTPPYTYYWTDPATQTTPEATGLAPGSYEVFVIDNNDCVDSAVVEVGFVVKTNELAGGSQFLIFPNPSPGRFETRVQFAVPPGVQWLIVDNLGRQVVDFLVETNLGGIFIIRLENAPGGIYRVMLKDAAGNTLGAASVVIVK